MLKNTKKGLPAGKIDKQQKKTTVFLAFTGPPRTCPRGKGKTKKKDGQRRTAAIKGFEDRRRKCQKGRGETSTSGSEQRFQTEGERTTPARESETKNHQLECPFVGGLGGKEKGVVKLRGTNV